MLRCIERIVFIDFAQYWHCTVPYYATPNFYAIHRIFIVDFNSKMVCWIVWIVQFCNRRDSQRTISVTVFLILCIFLEYFSCLVKCFVYIYILFAIEKKQSNILALPCVIACSKCFRLSPNSQRIFVLLFKKKLKYMYQRCIITKSEMNVLNGLMRTVFQTR